MDTFEILGVCILAVVIVLIVIGVREVVKHERDSNRRRCLELRAEAQQLMNEAQQLVGRAAVRPQFMHDFAQMQEAMDALIEISADDPRLGRAVSCMSMFTFLEGCKKLRDDLKEEVARVDGIPERIQDLSSDLADLEGTLKEIMAEDVPEDFEGECFEDEDLDNAGSALQEAREKLEQAKSLHPLAGCDPHGVADLLDGVHELLDRAEEILEDEDEEDEDRRRGVEEEEEESFFSSF